LLNNLNDIEIFTVEVLEEECKKVENDDNIISEKRFVLECDICCNFYFYYTPCKQSLGGI
jgi:hypothetical protein